MGGSEDIAAAASAVESNPISRIEAQPAPDAPTVKQPLSAAGSKSVNLRAFNLYAAKVRKETKDQNLSITGYDIERLIGKKWAKLGEDERREFTEQARLERAEKIRQGVIEPDSGEKVKKKKRKNEVDLLALALKQQKPEDKGVLLAHMPGLVRPKRRKAGHHVDATIGDGSRAATLIGSPVNGVIDGMFDAGYFVTLQVGEKKQSFKGIIFRPDYAGANGRTDVAPRVWTLDTNGAGRGHEGGGVNAAALAGANGHAGVNGDEVMVEREPRLNPEEGNGQLCPTREEHIHSEAGLDRVEIANGAEVQSVNPDLMEIEGANGHQDVNRHPTPGGEGDVTEGGETEREENGNIQVQLVEKQDVSRSEEEEGVAGDTGGAHETGEKNETADGASEGRQLETRSPGDGEVGTGVVRNEPGQVAGENATAGSGVMDGQGDVNGQQEELSQQEKVSEQAKV